MGRLDNWILKKKVEEFVIDALKYLNKLYPSANWLEKQILNQVVRSIGSIGANLQEADMTSSEKDFYRLLNISLREAKESQYWLKLLKLVWNRDINSYLNELEEIIRIIFVILKNKKL